MSNFLRSSRTIEISKYYGGMVLNRGIEGKIDEK